MYSFHTERSYVLASVLFVLLVVVFLIFCLEIFFFHRKIPNRHTFSCILFFHIKVLDIYLSVSENEKPQLSMYFMKHFILHQSKY